MGEIRLCCAHGVGFCHHCCR